MHLLELGDGWAAAILNSEEEFEYLWTVRMQVGGMYVGIGGSTNSQQDKLDYSEYLPDDTGRMYIQKYILLLPLLVI